jgi:hypothetical protein
VKVYDISAEREESNVQMLCTYAAVSIECVEDGMKIG